ncbi:hypothetical protein ACLBWT_16185 [Paenibacillus sp. D51F]
MNAFISYTPPSSRIVADQDQSVNETGERPAIAGKKIRKRG